MYKKNQISAMTNFHIPDCEEFKDGINAYNMKEKRGPIWFSALSTVTTNWGKPAKMAEGIHELIKGWNRFYSDIDLQKLSTCIKKNQTTLTGLKGRHIISLSNKDIPIIEDLFRQFLSALARVKDDRESPVSVAKAFSLLAPDFLPIWDILIAWAYGSITASGTYIPFCLKMKILYEKVKHCIPPGDDRSLLKRIDEYNYSKYTMKWI